MKNPDPKNVEVTEEHEQWALEKETEGLDPEVEKASEDLEKELLEETAEA